MTLERGSTILVDTNIIIEAHRCGIWTSLCNGFHIVTVEKCVEETQTGYQNRKPEQTIGSGQLKETLHQIATVSDTERANLQVQYVNAVSLDIGERELLAHALTREDKFLVASPDTAALRAAMALKLGDSMISLEEMIEVLGIKPHLPLRSNYSRKWLSGKRTDILLS